MNLTQPPTGEPFPEPLFSIVKEILSPRDKALLIAGWADGLTDAEIAEVFGPDAADRILELERGINKLISFEIEIASWKAAEKARVSGSETSADVAENAEAARC